MRSVIVIPARYGSSRLPGKPLADICGKPMIQHVHERASQARCAERVIVATDDERVARAVEAFGGEAVMTSPLHASGTERIIEVAEKAPADIYINVQGDEPLIRPSDIDLMADLLRSDSAADMASLYHVITAEEAENPNTVKVVTDHKGNALYFSRARIPYPRDKERSEYKKHIGLYGYRAELLRRYPEFPASDLESTEMLEQLRVLQAGFRIRMAETSETGPSVDTREDLEKVRAIIAGEPPPIAPNPLAAIRLIITDVDGVLTTGHLEYSAEGETLKRFHVRDGLGISLLQKCDIQVAILTGRGSPALERRLRDLRIGLYIQQAKDKRAACLQLMSQAGVGPSESAFIGDDSIDLPAFEACGISFAVADAPEYVKRAATHVLASKGGEGAFREVAERVLRARGLARVFETADGFLEASARDARQ